MANNALRDGHLLGRMLLRRNNGNVISTARCRCHNVRCFVRPPTIRKKATTKYHELPMSSNNTFNSGVQQRRVALLFTPVNTSVSQPDTSVLG